VFSVWAQGHTVTIERYIIGGVDVTHEYSDAFFISVGRNADRVSPAGTKYRTRVFDIDLTLNNATGEFAERITLTDGLFAGGRQIYFYDAVFPKRQGRAFRAEYATMPSDDGTTLRMWLSFYDTSVDSLRPYAVLEMSRPQ